MSAVAVAVGLVADAAVGEPPTAWHPVARYGALMEWVERRIYSPRRSAGVAYVATGVVLATATGLGLRRLVGPQAATAVAVAACAAGRMLDAEAAVIAGRLEAGDLDGARRRLQSLAGRDADGLGGSEISRAVVESLAENCVDAVTATALWGVVGGAPAVLVHRAVNTLDAMVGHRNTRYERFGWASARLDDVLNWVPARITAMAVVVARPARTADTIGTVLRDAHRHPSPNGGVVEAAFAAALGVQLGGVNRYGDEVEDRGMLGDGRPPGPGDIDRAISLRRHATVAVAAAPVAVSVVRASRRLLRSRS